MASYSSSSSASSSLESSFSMMLTEKMVLLEVTISHGVSGSALRESMVVHICHFVACLVIA